MGTKNILEAIHALKPEYIDKPIIVIGNDVDTSEIIWGGATAISNADIQTKLTALQAAEDNYIEPRRQSYDSVLEQLDKLYHDMTAGKLDATGEWHKAIKAVKDANPKA
jgi:hypothetical protein